MAIALYINCLSLRIGPFFQNCFALRDWLKNSGALPAAEIDVLFANTIPLKLCRDICNGTKHFSINSPSIDPHFSIFREFDPSRIFRISVIAGGRGHPSEKRDLLEVADACLEAWKTFLKRKGLILEDE
jgi:hypothetical protein